MSTNISVPGGNIIYIRKNPNNNNIIEYSLNNTNVWNTISFRCYITNTNTNTGNGFVKVYFTTEINITDINQYFICNSDKIQFGSDSLNQDGTIPTINVNINNYGGFIDNNYGYNDILIFNLFVNGINGETTYITNTYAGWIARIYFKGSNNYIINCSSNGNIGHYGGGIVGAYAASSSSGSLYIIGCSSSGSIGNGAGGIVGGYAGYIYGQFIIKSCWSSGSLTGTYTGGIVGYNSYNGQIICCYSTGNISGPGAGGIVGSNSGIVSCTIKNCYSIGNISGENSGGICGRLDQDNIITIENCYTTGEIYNQDNAGGILGTCSITNPSANKRIIKNCYVSGSINTSDNKGYIVGGQTNGDVNTINVLFTIENCYSEAYNNTPGWNNSHANTVLLETPTSQPGIGGSWVLIYPNTPYYIFNMGYTPYSSKIIDKYENNQYYLIKTYSSSVLQSQFSTDAIITSLSYQKLQITDGNSNSYNSINIDINSGKIITTPSTIPEIYNIYISNIGYNNSLYFTTYSLTVVANISVNEDTIIYVRQNENNIEYSSTHITWTRIWFPCLITNTNANLGEVGKVYFTTDINITDINQYFICNSNKIQVGSDSLNQDGTIPTINVKVDNYDGFIDNSSGYSNILIFNLYVNGINEETTYITNTYAGWIARIYFRGLNNYIINCSSNGNIGDYGGGIVGANAASNGGSLYIIGCSSSGSISNYGGGIVGGYAGYDNGEVIIVSSRCSGSILGEGAGGIVGQDPRCRITNCYSSGEIVGNYAGGISGINTDTYSFYRITNCYSIGNISGEYSGGISGVSNNSTIECIVQNCYTTGNINGGNNAGGILGYIDFNNTALKIINCYVVGNTSENIGYIIGSQPYENTTNNIFTIENCYSEAYHNGSEWNDLNANTVLLGIPTYQSKFGGSWVSIYPNTPYYIFNMGYTPYSSKIIDKNANNQYYLIKTYSSSVFQSQSSNSAIISSLSYQKLKIIGGDLVSQNAITINSYNGIISTLSSTSPGSYTIYISNTGYNNSLYFTTYELTVNIPLKSPIIYMKSLFTDNSLIYYKPHSLSCGGVGTVKNYKAKCHKT